MTKEKETRSFQAEARQLLDLMIHSVYSHKDIFLRELISNSSDALDKRRFLAVTNPSALSSDTELHIRIAPDPEARTLSIIDNGIGMKRDEVIDLIGTIAKSGTREFLDAVKAAKDQSSAIDLIGQFGVGFYSCFMAADKVTLVTRHAEDDEAVRWESAGEGTYTIEEAERDEPGTTITLHLKPTDSEDGLSDYTQEWVIRDIVKRYSDFVAYPIKMEIERQEPELDEEGKPKEDGSTKAIRRDEALNSMKAIWLRDADDVSDEEYSEFYKHISHDWQDPLFRIQAKIEGTLEYRLLLFIPSAAPFDLFRTEGRRGVNLYVRRVFIMDECEELIPMYLRFVRGVVDSEDLSLNISRELLQQNRQIQRIRRGLVNKVLDSLKKSAEEDKEKYQTFWREFGAVLKEGIFQDTDNREALLDLLLAYSTEAKEKPVSLADYVERMKPDQEAIYYVTGESRETLEKSPHLEAFTDKGYEVLILTEPVDEIWTQGVTEYNGKPLKSIGKGDIDLGSEEEKKKAEEELGEQQKSYADLFEALKDKLADDIKEVRLSKRLTSSLACLVSDEHDITPQMEQIMRAMNQEVPHVKRILELNPKHAVLAKLQEVFAEDGNDARIGDYAHLIYGQALLAEGGQLPDPAQFSKLVTDLMSKGL